MRAIVVEQLTQPDALRIGEAPEPASRPGHLVVEVKAAGVNFFDTLIVEGKYQVKPPFPFIPGGELAGVVLDVGEGVSGFRVGDRVFANLTFGAYAERASVPASAASVMPALMTFEEAAAFPIVYGTSYAALTARAGLRKGETLLVHAAAGGVGTAAVQIGKAMGARVIATAGGAEKLDVARRAGADVVIDYKTEDWVARVLASTDGRGADVIYDSVGGDIFDGSMKCVAWSGRILVVGFASGRIPEVKLNRVMLKNIAVVGVHWQPNATHDPERGIRERRELLDLYEKGTVAPMIYKTFPLAELPSALKALGARQTWGKVVVVP